MMFFIQIFLGVFSINAVLCFQDVFFENCLNVVSNYQLHWWLVGELPPTVVNTVFGCSDVTSALEVVKHSNTTSTIAVVTSTMANMLLSINKKRLTRISIRNNSQRQCLAKPIIDQQSIALNTLGSNSLMIPLTSLEKKIFCNATNQRQHWSDEFKEIINGIKWNGNKNEYLTVYVYKSNDFEMANVYNQTSCTQNQNSENKELELVPPSVKIPRIRELSKLFYRIGVIKSPPIMSFDVDKNGKVVNVTGLISDILSTLATALDFNYTLVPLEGYGIQLPNGEWTGATRSLIAKEIDLLAADYTNNPSRALAMDFTVPFMQASQRVVIQRSLQTATANELLRTHLKPFKWPIWLTIVLVLISGTALFYYIEYSNRKNHKTDLNQLNISVVKNHVKVVAKSVKRKEAWWAVFFYLFGLFCQQGCDLVPFHASGRIVLYTMCLTALVCYNFYTSVFISFTTVSKNVIPVDNLADVLKDKSFMVGFVKNNKVEDIFKITSSPVFQKAWTRMQKSGEMYVANTTDGLARALNEKFAFISDSHRLEWYTFNNCSYKLLQDKIFQEGFHFALPLNSPDSAVFSKYLKRVVESGMVTRMRMSHMPVYSKDTCASEVFLEPVGLDRMTGIFICLTAGFVFAFLSLWLEFINQQNLRRIKTRVVIQGK